MPKEIPLHVKGFNPFCDLIGLAFESCGEGASRCVLEMTDDLLNPNGVLHGGALYTMADTGMGGALYSRLDEGELGATIEIKINYFAAVRSGRIVCDTRIVHQGKRVAVLESEMKKDDRLVAKAMGTYTIFRPG